MSGANRHRTGPGSQKRNPGMYVGEESNIGIVPAKPPNKTEGFVAEVVEGRLVTKENIMESNIRLTQNRERVSQGFGGVREGAPPLT